MDISRAGESQNNHHHIRTDRFFSAQGEWFFSTREGSPIGPFENKDHAREGLTDFIEFMSLAEPKTLSRLHEALTAQ